MKSNVRCPREIPSIKELYGEFNHLIAFTIYCKAELFTNQIWLKIVTCLHSVPIHFIFLMQSFSEGFWGLPHSCCPTWWKGRFNNVQSNSGEQSRALQGGTWPPSKEEELECQREERETWEDVTRARRNWETHTWYSPRTQKIEFPDLSKKQWKVTK